MKALSKSNVMPHVVLSRRNLENLLHMLDNRDKARPALDNGVLIVEAEEDEEHYADRALGAPGHTSWEPS